MLFEVAILEVPTKKEQEDGVGVEKLVFGPAYVIAKDANGAAYKALMGNGGDDKPNVDIDKAQVLVRPFA